MGVRFISVRLKSTFLALETKDPSTLYWIIETSELFKGDQLFGTGSLATEQAAGLLSAEDYAKLRAIAGLDKLIAVDGTIKLTDTADGGKSVSVVVASDERNALRAVDGGLFVPTVVVPEYSIEKQESPTDGFAATYKLKKVENGEISYVGDAINIAKDLVLQNATLETVTENGVPYDDAKIGDPYIKMVFNNAEASNLYVPVKGLVDVYTAGDGIKIENGIVSVKLANTTSGLRFVDGALDIAVATRKADGAMSAKDKLVVDSIPYTYVARKYDISNVPVGTLIDYRDHEIRIMCPADAEFTKQEVGENGNSNMYYMTFRAYAPDNAVSFKEGDRGEIIDEMHTFDGSASGVDEFGRRYSVCWLALASLNESTNTWTYFGKTSTASKYIGWDYCVEWYNADGKRIGYDSVRINLSNESCHNINKPYYMANFATTNDVDSLRDDMERNLSWSEM